MPQSLLQILSASLHLLQRGDEPRPGPGNLGHLARVGRCLCGAPVAWHFDQNNRFVSCGHLGMLDQGGAQALPESRRDIRSEASGERGPR